MSNKIAFLFGAGISIPSNMLNTSELTDKVLEGDDIYYNKADNKFCYMDYVDDRDQSKDNEIPIRVRKLLRVLHNYFYQHYSFMNRQINYEDYYYLINELHFEEAGELENPVVQYFANHLYQTHSELFEPVADHYSSLDLITLMSIAKKYIRFVVAYYLNQKPSNVCQFNLLQYLNQDENFNKIFLFTLNHDLLIEQALLERGIIFSDGFVESNLGLRIWDKNSYDQKINLFKLHGSINWAISDTPDPYKKNVGIYPTEKCLYMDDAPIILIGSMNKVFEYSRKIFFDLQCLFSENLEKCDRIIISGYGFIDKGINSRIIHWLYGSSDRKIIIIHKNEEELFQNARPAIQHLRHWDVTQKTNLIRTIPKWFEETNWAEIKELL